MRTSALERPEAPLARAACSQRTTLPTPRAASAWAMLTPLTPPPTTTTSAVSVTRRSSAASAPRPGGASPATACGAHFLYPMPLGRGYLIMCSASATVSHRGSGGVSRDDGRTAIRDDRVRAPRGDLSLSATRDLPGDRGRGPVAGDVSASLSRLPNARPGRERPGLALRHR